MVVSALDHVSTTLESFDLSSIGYHTLAVTRVAAAIQVLAISQHSNTYASEAVASAVIFGQEAEFHP